jgi:hypothetical protein
MTNNKQDQSGWLFVAITAAPAVLIGLAAFLNDRKYKGLHKTLNAHESESLVCIAQSYSRLIDTAKSPGSTMHDVLAKIDEEDIFLTTVIEETKK